METLSNSSRHLQTTPLSAGGPVLSVIITCYNHARYLPQAIESVLDQQCPNVEIIVVDDGSTDNTADVARRYPQVCYIHQKNAGISVARNMGIDQSHGEFLVFLDADDWFLENAFRASLAALQANPAAAFVYGTHIKVSEKWTAPAGEEQALTENHYRNLLRYNFIAMHACVFYRRWAFDGVRFDTRLRATEDLDVYLKITRHHPVAYHPHVVAAYRKSGDSLSTNVPLMIRTGNEVLRRQKSLLRNQEERTWWRTGRQHLHQFYGRELYEQLMKTPAGMAIRKRRKELFCLFVCDKRLLLNYTIRKLQMGLKRLLKTNAPTFLLRWLHDAGMYKSYRPAAGNIRRGDFAAVQPFSNNFGYERGGPIDRYYIENFLEENAALIKGRVLEIGDNEYTLRYGGSRVTQSDVLHVEEGNPKATFVGDLSNAPHLPDNAFDCIVLTQTLHLIYHAVDALRTCHRILKPGGVLLLTSPGITHIDQGEWRNYWYWSFTQASIDRMFSESFPPGSVTTKTFGNVLVATAFLYGMGQPELTKKELDAHDPHYQVTITALAQKTLA